MTDIQRRWDLWNLKSLFPQWGEEELQELLRDGAAQDARQQELFADPKVAHRRFAAEAGQVLSDHPELTTGLTVSLHLGPYSLAPVPWLIAGLDVHVLVNRSSLSEIRPVYETLQSQLDLPGKVIWVPIEGKGFALHLLRALRRKQPVFAFLDGNDGLDGCEGTLRDGVIHRLPGRDIRVRTGLARLALRLRCPVNSLVTVWDEQGGFGWRRGPTWRWRPGTTATAATTELFTWAFGMIRRHPSQWRAWNMLTGVYDSYRADETVTNMEFGDPREVTDPESHDLALCWRREANVWPGDMLEDVAGGCFYAAAGFLPADLELLQAQESFTPRDIRMWRGRRWLQDHLPRLVALGFVGRWTAPGGDCEVVRPESLLIQPG